MAVESLFLSEFLATRVATVRRRSSVNVHVNLKRRFLGKSSTADCALIIGELFLILRVFYMMKNSFIITQKKAKMGQEKKAI